MLRWSLAFLIVALVAALLGFTPLGGAANAVARIVFFVVLVLFATSLLFDTRAPKDLG